MGSVARLAAGLCLALLGLVGPSDTFAAFTLTGTVTDSKGKGLAGVHLDLTAALDDAPLELRSTTTDQNGFFSFDITALPGWLTLKPTLPGTSFFPETWLLTEDGRDRSLTASFHAVGLTTLPSLAPPAGIRLSFANRAPHPLYSEAPIAVAEAGDVNGDGLDDLLLNAGDQAALVYGRRVLPVDGQLSLVTDPTGTQWVRLVSSADSWKLSPTQRPRDEMRGLSDLNTPIDGYPDVAFVGEGIGDLTGVGDVDADGLADFVISSPRALGGRGRISLILGSSSGLGTGGQLDVGAASSSIFEFIGKDSAQQAGLVMSAAGDLDNDGFDDFLVSAGPAAFVVWGAPRGSLAGGVLEDSPRVSRLMTLDDDTFVAGKHTLAAAGDVNGDGFDDVLIGDHGHPAFSEGFVADAKRRQAFLVYGQSQRDQWKRSRLVGSVGPNMNMRETHFGWSVAGTGDADGDGFEDFLIGAPSFSEPSFSLTAQPVAGRSIWVRGREGFFSTNSLVDLSASGMGRWRFEGTLRQSVGIALTGAGDVDGDGLADFVIGANRDQGRAHLIRGQSSRSGAIEGLPDPFILGGHNSLDRLGTLYTGVEAFGAAGLWLAPAGDFNGDGVGDFAVGSAGDNVAFLVLGSATTNVVTSRNRLAGVTNGPTEVNPVSVPAKAVGRSPSGVMRRAFTRVSIGFANGFGGGVSPRPSLQTATLGKAAVVAPTNLVSPLKPAGVHWKLETTRRDFRQSVLTFHYLPEEIAGLDAGKLDVWYTASTSPNVVSSWVPLAAQHDPLRRTFSVIRNHTPGSAALEFNGTYAIFEGRQIFVLGRVITPPANVNVSNLLASGPSVEFADGRPNAPHAVWDQPSRQLFAVRPGDVVVRWINQANVAVAVTRATLAWPTLDSEFQPHVLGTPAVDLSGFQLAILQATETDASSEDVSTHRRFLPLREGRSLIQLSQAGSGPAFQLVKTYAWNRLPSLREKSVVIGDEALPDPGQQDPTCGGSFLLTLRPRCAVGAGFFDPVQRSGSIVAVNQRLPGDPETDLVVAWSRVGNKLIRARSQDSFPAVCWFDGATRFLAEWPTNAPTIVISSQLGAGAIDGARFGADWDLYVQNDVGKRGFNPNDEHARKALNRNGELTLMPLRSDLDSRETSAPFVLMAYTDPSTSKRRVQVFGVVAEDSAHPFLQRVIAGSPILPPLPFGADAPCPDSRIEVPGVDDVVVFRDRKDGFWAKAAGRDGQSSAEASILWWYPAREDYFFPSFYPRPADGCVPFLDRHASTPGRPISFRYVIDWPTEAPTLFIGESLVEAKRGLPTISVPPSADGTPGLGGPCSVDIIYQQASVLSPNRRSVRLIDPLKAHAVTMGVLPTEIAVEASGVRLRFKDLPPQMHPRLSYERISDSQGRLELRGLYFSEPGNSEGSYYLPNTLSPAEESLVAGLSSDPNWRSAVRALASAADADLEFTEADTDRDLLAVSAGAATGTGWVTLAFQNRGRPLCENEPISLFLFKVERLRAGETVVIEPECVFDEAITLRHKGDFGGNPNAWDFEWRLRPSGAEGDAPPPVSSTDSAAGWEPVLSGPGEVAFTIRGSSPYTLADNRLIVRFRPLDPDTLALVRTPENELGWSDWTAPRQVDGWIKRVLSGIGPFEQRFKQLGDPAKTINTTVDMLAQAGKRWEGAVPLNCKNIDAFGLIEIYETVLNRGVQFSLDQGISSQPANDALLLAASRLSDLYQLMGNEAFADASDPSLSLFNSAVAGGKYVSLASSLHAFADLAQAPDLLSEELVLLRGRDDSALPPVTRAPYYNRFPWNFSGDLGEVAYMANYDIRDANGSFDGVINEADAQRFYPQGHGDAWGHYLTALHTYYRLASNPRFTWVPRREIVRIGGADVEVDYQEEQKFAHAAAAKARTGAEIVNLTYRARYSDNPAKQFRGYADERGERAWGVNEWAIRAGQGAYFDWLLGNSLLPESTSTPPPAGKQKIDRGTVQDLAEIPASYERIQTELDAADRGLNPLGLQRNVMPFDISSSEFEAGQTYFDQVYDRAIKALSSAITTFYYAENNSQELRQQNDRLASFQNEVRAQESDFQSRLIEVFGQPFAEDIGQGGTYPAGYRGPDIFHFDYVDPSDLLGIARDPSDLTVQARVFPVTYTKESLVLSPNGTINVKIGPNGLLESAPLTVNFATTESFGLTKPQSWTKRLSAGELQQSRSDLLQQMGEFKIAIGNYNSLLEEIADKANLIQAQFNVQAEKIRIANELNQTLHNLNVGIRVAGIAKFVAKDTIDFAKDVEKAVEEALPKVVGTATDATSAIRSALRFAGLAGTIGLGIIAQNSEFAQLNMELSKSEKEQASALQIEEIEGNFALHESLTELRSMIRNESSLRYDLYVRGEAIQQTIARRQAALAKGLRLLEEFKRFRLETSAAVQLLRYKDMAYRVFRNDALQKYRAQFDLAARYCYLAVRAFDYETAFLPGDRRAPGEDFIQQIIRSRVLGNMQDGDGDGFWNPHPAQGSGDPGLADAMLRLRNNWDLVIKAQLGLNNGQPDRARFSLRYDLFQILPHDPDRDPEAEPNAASGQAWREKLSSSGVRQANVLRLDVFNRYCIPFSPRDEVNGEPALVIPFTTTISAGQNFFGNPLVENQEQFDSTRFATKIRSVKILMEGLADSGLVSQPLVYLIPVGADIMRSPSDLQNNQTRAWTILDQVLLPPFPLSFRLGDQPPAELFQPGWIPSVDGLNRALDENGSPRRHSTIKAYDLTVGGEANADVRLVGRSVWNSEWVLIIPGRNLFSNAAEGIARFIQGRVVNATTGERDGRGVRDIALEFEVYSYSAR